MLEANKTVVKKQMEEFNKLNMDVGAAMNTPDYKLHFPIGSEPKNTEQHKEVLKAFWTAFPDMTHTIDRLVAEGDFVVGLYTIRATHKAEFMGIPASGKKIEEPIIGIWRVDNGKIAEFWGVMDMAGFTGQISKK